MKIGFFVSEFPYLREDSDSIQWVGGGVGFVMWHIARALAYKGHQIIIYTTHSPQYEGITEGKMKNIELIRYPSTFIIGEAPVAASMLHKPLLDMRDFDIIHGHMGNLPAPYAAYLAAKWKNIPLITTYHQNSVGGYGSISRRVGVYLYEKYFSEKILEGSDRIVALSSNCIVESLKLEKNQKKINVIPNGIDIEKYDLPASKELCRNILGLPGKKKIILYMGSLIPLKSPHTLLNAFQIVQQHYPDSYLVIMGDGNLRQELENAARNMNLEEDVKFTGFINGGRKVYYLKSADIFVLPSLTESFSIALLEALLVGLPSIVSNLKSLENIVHAGENGFFAEIQNESDFAGKILYLLENEAILEDMGIKARESVLNNTDRFDWSNIAREHEKMYREVL